MNPCLEFKDVRKTYSARRGIFGHAVDVHAVDGVDLAVAHGETVGLVGESGCGKSTLARMAVRLEPPTSGNVLMDGRDLWSDPDLPARMPELVQMVFQDPFSSLDPRMTVAQSVVEGLTARGVGDRASRQDRVMELLDMVGLSASHAKRYPHQLSGGQRQRVAIARALALNPRLVVCDEPVSALDVSIQAQVINILQDLKDRLGLTYLFISHDLAVVSHLSDRVAVMYAGRLVELAPADELYSRPLHPYTRRLLAAIPQPRPAASAQGQVAGDTPGGHGPRQPLPSGASLPDAPCPLAYDCDLSDSTCRETRPAWTQAASGHFVRCGRI